MTDESPRVIHLAAGEGTRLQPITDDRPKPLVELGGKSLLERNIQTLTAAGLSDQVVATGYRADQIEALGHQTFRNPVYDETDMVYSLFCGEQHFPTGRDLIISYGDIIYEQSLVESLLDCDAPLCVVIDREWQQLWAERFDDPLDDAETLRFDEKYALEEIGGKPSSLEQIEAQYVGLIKIRSDHIDPFTDMYYELSEPTEGNETRSSVEMTHFIQRMIDNNWTVQGVLVDGGWVEIDTTADLELYRSKLESGTLDEFIRL